MQEDSLTYQYNRPILEEYFSRKYSSSGQLFEPLDSRELKTFKIQSKLKQIPISQQPQTFDLVFCIFLVLFISLSHVIGKKIKLFPSLFNELIIIKERHSIFSETTEDEWYGKLFLGLQTCLILSVFLCQYFSLHVKTITDNPLETGIFLLYSFFALILFFVFKWILYEMIGRVFFGKMSHQIWLNNYFSLLAYSGIILFIPVLCYFYIKEIRDFCFYFVLGYAILLEIIVIYRSFLLFFHKAGHLIYLFLYLCGQEIVPLFFLWKTMVYIFNFVEKSTHTLWH